jgi:hypothetical protein
MAGTPDVRVRRAYDQPSPDDGERFLVDRLSPVEPPTACPQCGTAIPRL